LAITQVMHDIILWAQVQNRVYCKSRDERVLLTRVDSHLDYCENRGSKTLRNVGTVTGFWGHPTTRSHYFLGIPLPPFLTTPYHAYTYIF
jgi:hypothetical protein